MFKKIINKITAKNNSKNENNTDNLFILSKSLEENISNIKEQFADDDTLIIRSFENAQNKDIKFSIVFTDGMVSSTQLNDNIIKPLLTYTGFNTKLNLMDAIIYHVLSSNSVKKLTDENEIIDSIVRGNPVLFAQGESEVVSIDSKGWQTRAISEPEVEKSLRGSREGFTESLLMNLTMIRRRLATNKLKFKMQVLGKQTKTKICICYLDGIANKKILDELNKRLDKIDIDGITGSGIIVEFIKDYPYSPFKTIGGTERPDVIATKLLEGRIAIFVDGTPFVLTLPYVFIEYFQTSEDYYLNFYYASINRLLRILSFFITISAPALYIAITTFHQEMIPTVFVRSIIAARQGVPFPTVLEMVMLLIVFELLRETGVRMPSFSGTAVSVVGGLVLGSAAVDARIVSAPVVIVVALTAVTGLTTPKIKGPAILLRFILIALSATIGLYGYLFGISALLIHLLQLRSFGIPYMLSITNFRLNDMKDTVIRAPWNFLKYRSEFIAPDNLVRNNSGGKKK
ncbi:spore germination protein [Ruminiclostridium herbifermentans]|uniref:Spore germination protein n=1 Tax=Ruminiclostridium herbifermentans TaxID=2488810 RepID=A0A4U7JLB6_9FIRM|nr:spore germination protein [Ruminiclostridium herbifermentans]QNU65971.1 spore germination protein [Ruminiclostridium herbifermentans]